MNTDQIALTALIAARFNALQDKRKKVTERDIDFAYDQFLWDQRGTINAIFPGELVRHVDAAVTEVIERTKDA